MDSLAPSDISLDVDAILGDVRAMAREDCKAWGPKRRSRSQSGLLKTRINDSFPVNVATSLAHYKKTRSMKLDSPIPESINTPTPLFLLQQRRGEISEMISSQTLVGDHKPNEVLIQLSALEALSTSEATREVSEAVTVHASRSMTLKPFDSLPIHDALFPPESLVHLDAPPMSVPTRTAAALVLADLVLLEQNMQGHKTAAQIEDEVAELLVKSTQEENALVDILSPEPLDADALLRALRTANARPAGEEATDVELSAAPAVGVAVRDAIMASESRRTRESQAEAGERGVTSTDRDQTVDEDTFMGAARGVMLSTSRPPPAMLAAQTPADSLHAAHGARSAPEEEDEEGSGGSSQRLEAELAELQGWLTVAERMREATDTPGVAAPRVNVAFGRHSSHTAVQAARAAAGWEKQREQAVVALAAKNARLAALNRAAKERERARGLAQADAERAREAQRLERERLACDELARARVETQQQLLRERAQAETTSQARLRPRALPPASADPASASPTEAVTREVSLAASSAVGSSTARRVVPQHVLMDAWARSAPFMRKPVARIVPLTQRPVPRGMAALQAARVVVALRHDSIIRKHLRIAYACAQRRRALARRLAAAQRVRDLRHLRASYPTQTPAMISAPLPSLALAALKLLPRPVAHSFAPSTQPAPARLPERAALAQYDAERGLAYLRPQRYTRAATLGPAGGPLRSLACDRYGATGDDTNEDIALPPLYAHTLHAQATSSGAVCDLSRAEEALRRRSVWSLAWERQQGRSPYENDADMAELTTLTALLKDSTAETPLDEQLLLRARALQARLAGRARREGDALLLQPQYHAVLPVTHGGAWARAPRLVTFLATSTAHSQPSASSTGELTHAEATEARRRARVVLLRACASALVDVQRLCVRAGWYHVDALLRNGFSREVTDGAMDAVDLAAVRVAPHEGVLQAALAGLSKTAPDGAQPWPARVAAAAARALSGVQRCLQAFASTQAHITDTDVELHPSYCSLGGLGDAILVTAAQAIDTASAVRPVLAPAVPFGGQSLPHEAAHAVLHTPPRAVLLHALRRLVPVITLLAHDQHAHHELALALNTAANRSRERTLASARRAARGSTLLDTPDTERTLTLTKPCTPTAIIGVPNAHACSLPSAGAVSIPLGQLASRTRHTQPRVDIPHSHPRCTPPPSPPPSSTTPASPPTSPLRSPLPPFQPQPLPTAPSSPQPPALPLARPARLAAPALSPPLARPLLHLEAALRLTRRRLDKGVPFSRLASRDAGRAVGSATSSSTGTGAPKGVNGANGGGGGARALPRTPKVNMLLSPPNIPLLVQRTGHTHVVAGYTQRKDAEDMEEAGEWQAEWTAWVGAHRWPSAGSTAGSSSSTVADSPAMAVHGMGGGPRDTNAAEADAGTEVEMDWVVWAPHVWHRPPAVPLAHALPQAACAPPPVWPGSDMPLHSSGSTMLAIPRSPQPLRRGTATTPRPSPPSSPTCSPRLPHTHAHAHAQGHSGPHVLADAPAIAVALAGSERVAASASPVYAPSQALHWLAPRSPHAEPGEPTHTVHLSPSRPRGRMAVEASHPASNGWLPHPYAAADAHVSAPMPQSVSCTLAGRTRRAAVPPVDLRAVHDGSDSSASEEGGGTDVTVYSDSDSDIDSDSGLDTFLAVPFYARAPAHTRPASSPLSLDLGSRRTHTGAPARACASLNVAHSTPLPAIVPSPALVLQHRAHATAITTVTHASSPPPSPSASLARDTSAHAHATRTSRPPMHCHGNANPADTSAPSVYNNNDNDCNDARWLDRGAPHMPPALPLPSATAKRHPSTLTPYVSLPSRTRMLPSVSLASTAMPTCSVRGLAAAAIASPARTRATARNVKECTKGIPLPSPLCPAHTPTPSPLLPSPQHSLPSDDVASALPAVLLPSRTEALRPVPPSPVPTQSVFDRRRSHAPSLPMPRPHKRAMEAASRTPLAPSPAHDMFSVYVAGNTKTHSASVTYDTARSYRTQTTHVLLAEAAEANLATTTPYAHASPSASMRAARLPPAPSVSLRSATASTASTASVSTDTATTSFLADASTPTADTTPLSRVVAVPLRPVLKRKTRVRFSPPRGKSVHFGTAELREFVFVPAEWQSDDYSLSPCMSPRLDGESSFPYASFEPYDSFDHELPEGYADIVPRDVL